MMFQDPKNVHGTLLNAIKLIYEGKNIAYLGIAQTNRALSLSLSLVYPFLPTCAYASAVWLEALPPADPCYR